MSWSIDEDVERIAEECVHDLRALDKSRVLIAGGTGFIGTWLLKVLKHVLEKGYISLDIHILTRNSSAFADRVPDLGTYDGFTFHQGDVSNFSFSPDLKLDYVFHGATDASAKLNAENPLHMFRTVVEGTTNMMNVACQAGAKRVLLLSSGAVYGPQPWDMMHVAETWMGAPDCTNPVQTYAEAKRAAELVAAIYNRDTSLQVTTARIFAVLGPLLPLGTHFAAGNFLGEALSKKPAIVRGNGLAVRSYIYPIDLIKYLLAIWVRGSAGAAYNVGSNHGISIGDLAKRISQLVGTGEFEILGKADEGWNPGRYVPDLAKVEQELNLTLSIDLDQAILSTAKYYAAAIAR